jgi:hypothetical protein
MRKTSAVVLAVLLSSAEGAKLNKQDNNSLAQ